MKIVLTTKAEKDLRKAKKQGKNLDLFFDVINILCKGEELPSKNRNHGLSGQYKSCKECHVLPDWLLIYKIDIHADELIIYRVGTHSELF